MSDLAELEVTTPYPGLRPFEAHEASIFFGREVHIDRLLEILKRERFLAVIGASGSGKSSLVKAGLLPALSAGWIGTGSDWRIADFRPGERPLGRLARALLRPEVLGAEFRASMSATPSEADSAVMPLVEAELRRGPLGLLHLVGDVFRIDISHEALIRQWLRLWGWVDNEFERAAQYRRWRDRAVTWIKQGGALLQGADLSRALDWYLGGESWRPDELWASRYAARASEVGPQLALTAHFIEASQREATQREQARLEAESTAAQQARAEVAQARADAETGLREAAERHAGRVRRWAALAFGVAAVAVILALVAGAFWLKAKESAAEALARQLVAESVAQSALAPDLAQLLAVEAFRLRPIAATTGHLRTSFADFVGLKKTLRGHERSVNHAAFSPDGKLIVTASGDRSARLWDLSGKPLAQLRGHEDSVNHAAFSPDGKLVVTASDDGSAWLWPCGVCSPAELLAEEILARVGRQLSAEERAASGLAPLAEKR